MQRKSLTSFGFTQIIILYPFPKSNNFCIRAITSGTVTWYGVPTNFGALSLISEIVTTTGIVFLLPVANIVQVTYENDI